MQVWTDNEVSGVVGVFHLQGSFWDRTRRRFTTTVAAPEPLSCEVYVRDFESLSAVLERLPAPASGRYAVLEHSSGKLALAEGAGGYVAVTVTAQSADVLTCTPTVQSGGVEFAPMGLANMFNSGGAVKSWAVHGKDSKGNGSKRGGGGHRAQHEVVLHGEGDFVAYSSVLPAKVQADGADVPLGTVAWDQYSGKLTVEVTAEDADASIEHVLRFVY